MKNYAGNVCGKIHAQTPVWNFEKILRAVDAVPRVRGGETLRVAHAQHAHVVAPLHYTGRRDDQPDQSAAQKIHRRRRQEF